MKFWTEGYVEGGYSDDRGILLGEVVSVHKKKNKIIFTEECDGYHKESFSKKEALEIVEELKVWILNQ